MAESKTKKRVEHHDDEQHRSAKRRRTPGGVCLLANMTTSADDTEGNPNLDAVTGDEDHFVPAYKSILPFRYSFHRLADLYDLGRELGSGSQGVIRLCKCRSSGEMYACKTLSKSSLRDMSYVALEVSIMTCLSQEDLPYGHDHDQLDDSRLHAQDGNTRKGVHNGTGLRNDNHNVVHLHEVVEDEDSVHMVMELCRGGDLFHRLTKKRVFSEYEAARIMRQLMVTVRYSHDLGVMHRDIKPENILFVDESLDSCDIRLADFGMGGIFAPGMTHRTVLGTALYMAPEMLRGPCYTEQVDVWSCGVVLYTMLGGGEPPFWDFTDEGTWNSIVRDDLKFPEYSWKNISASAKNLISEMLCKDPDMRMTPAEVLDHPWFTDALSRSPKDHVQQQQSSPYRQEYNLLDRVAHVLYGSRVPQRVQQQQQQCYRQKYSLLDRAVHLLYS